MIPSVRSSRAAIAKSRGKLAMAGWNVDAGSANLEIESARFIQTR
jgi:hypothetical protein